MLDQYFSISKLTRSLCFQREYRLMRIPLDYVYIRVTRSSCRECHCDVARVNIHCNNVALSKSLKFYAGPIFLFPNSLVRCASNGNIVSCVSHWIMFTYASLVPHVESAIAMLLVSISIVIMSYCRNH